jgi:myo-inositol-1-phosphate synthase
MRRPVSVAPPKGKLGVLTPGMGAVSTTFMAGVELVRRGQAVPVGSLTQMGTIRLGKRTDGRTPKIKDFVQLTKLDDLVFGGWDVFADDAYQAAAKAGVLDAKDLSKAEKFLKGIKPMKAVFDQNYVKNLTGPNVKKGKTKMDLAEQLRQDIRDFKKRNKLDRLVMVWCGSTEVFMKPEEVHKDLASFEKAMKANHSAIAPSMVYAYAAISEGVPFANGAPNLTVDIPALEDYAKSKNVPIGGKDFKTGQTLMKTVLAPGFKARML